MTPFGPIIETFRVSHSGGIHFRPAVRIAGIAMRHAGPVTAFCRETVADAKDRLELLLLAAGPGDSVTFTLAGPGADRVVAELRALFERRFRVD